MGSDPNSPKRLTILRHAKSSWANESLADHERPLAKRGLRDAPRMGERLAQRGLKPDLLFTSSATRARQTADLIEASLRRPALEMRVEPSVYLASPGKLLKLLSEMSDDIDELVLIGHNPGLTQLANMMLPDLKLGNLPTAGAVAIDCETGSWGDLDSARFSLRFYDYPKNPDPPR